MSFRELFKRSNEPGKVPQLYDLALGEIAINTFDGKLYTKQSDGVTETIVEIAGGGGGGGGYTGSRGYTGSASTVAGPTGYTGSVGADGAIGFTGSQGIQGVIGYTGSQGIQGVIGYTGSVGYVGSTGASFPTQTGHAGQFLATDGATPSWTFGGNVIPFTKEDTTVSNIPLSGVNNGNSLTLSTDLTFGSTATIHISDGNFGWKDLTGEINVKGVGSNLPVWSQVRDGLFAYAFEPDTMNECWVTYHINHDYAVGTPIYIHTHWCNASTNTGTVRWGFEYSIAKGHQQEIFPASTTVYVEQACTGQYYHMIGEISTGINTTSLETDALVMVRVFRDAAHANDTNTDTVHLLMADIHYQASHFATKNKAPNFNT